MLEGVFESGVTEGIARRVDGAVDVTQPVANGPQGVGDADGAEGVDQHHHVIRRPRHHESHQDGHDGACHLLLPRRCALLAPLGHCALLCHLEGNRWRHISGRNLRGFLCWPKWSEKD